MHISNPCSCTLGSFLSPSWAFFFFFSSLSNVKLGCCWEIKPIWVHDRTGGAFVSYLANDPGERSSLVLSDDHRRDQQGSLRSEWQCLANAQDILTHKEGKHYFFNFQSFLLHFMYCHIMKHFQRVVCHYPQPHRHRQHIKTHTQHAVLKCWEAVLTSYTFEGIPIFDGTVVGTVKPEIIHTSGKVWLKVTLIQSASCFFFYWKWHRLLPKDNKTMYKRHHCGKKNISQLLFTFVK